MGYLYAARVGILALVLVLTGCSNSTGNSTGTADIPSGSGFNDADVSFASKMIQHHAQALAMVDLTMDRPLSPEAQQLAEEIRGAQAPEVEKMVTWLQDWDQPIPETVRDHANAEGHDMDMDMGSDMPGMMSAQEMTALEESPDASFESRWLEMMTVHHEGAIEMSQEEQANGEFDKAVQLAEEIAAAQTAEIETMRSLL